MKTISPSKSQLVRVPATAHRLLKRLAAQENATQQEVLTNALDEYRRTRFLHSVNEGYASMKKNKAAWSSWRKEVSKWDVTLDDGALRKADRKRSKI